MLDKNPDTRATVDELLQTDWVTNSGKETVDVALVDKTGANMLDNVNRQLQYHSRRFDSDNTLFKFKPVLMEQSQGKQAESFGMATI